jgi:putative peptidoglycan lipid II flippase
LNLSFSNEFLFRFFGSRIPDGEGAIASLEYSWRLMFMIVSVFGQSLAAGFYPFISQLVVEKRYLEIHTITRSILIKIAAILGPLSGVCAVLAPSIITVLLRVGKFDARSVSTTAIPLALYLAGTWFYAATPLVYRLFYARSNTVMPLIINTGTVIACIPLYFAGTHRYGAAGIAFSSSVCMALQFFIVYGIYCKQHENPLAASTIIRLAAIAVISAAATATCLSLSDALKPVLIGISSPVPYSIAKGLMAGVPSLALAMALMLTFKIIDIKAIMKSLPGYPRR